MTTVEKPKRKRRTKAEIAADKLKAKEELFNKEYLPLGIPTILTVQQTAKLLKSTVKETREKCVNGLFVCEPHESEKNQWNIVTYQFIEEEHFGKFVTSYLKQLEINKVITPKFDNDKPEIEVIKKENNSRTMKKDKLKKEDIEEQIEEKPKRKRNTETIKEEEKTDVLEEVKSKRKRGSYKKVEVEEKKIEEKNSNDTLEKVKKEESPNEKENLSRLESFIQNKQKKKMDNVYQVPIVPEHAHYAVNDNVKLLEKFVLGEDCDEETLEYMDYYKKHLYGKKGIITKIEFAAKGHIVYTVYFEKYKEEMYCYHHYLEWLS